MPPINSIQAETGASMTASAPTSSLFQPWERQGSPWKQRPHQIRRAPRTRKGLVRPSGHGAAHPTHQRSLSGARCRPASRMDGAPSRRTRSSSAACKFFFGGLSIFLRRPVISDSSHQSMPNVIMWLKCPWDDRRFVRHLGNVRWRLSWNRTQKP